MRCRQVDTDDTRTTPAGDALICRTVAAVHQGADGYRLCVFLGEVDLATLDEAEEIVSNLRLRPPSSPSPPTRRTHASCTSSKYSYRMAAVYYSGATCCTLGRHTNSPIPELIGI